MSLKPIGKAQAGRPEPPERRNPLASWGVLDQDRCRNALGIRTIVDDANFYDQLKLLGVFFRLAGHGGLMICLDEMGTSTG